MGAYLCQSDADHPPNVVLMSIIEEGDLRRYNANHSDLFFQARYELPPGTIMYADLVAFKAFTTWSPEALKNSQDPAWIRPDAIRMGVYIMESTDDVAVDAAVLKHGGAALDSIDAAVLPTSSSGGGRRALGDVLDRSHSVPLHESSVAVAAEYLTPSEKLSESELGLILLHAVAVFRHLANCERILRHSQGGKSTWRLEGHDRGFGTRPCCFRSRRYFPRSRNAPILEV